MLNLKTCPTCGEKKLRVVCEDVAFGKGAARRVIPQVTFLRCDACGEQLFDHEANQKIDAVLFPRRTARRRKSA
jgi:YgiT-type zinc finger domain-containing protein